MQLATVRVNFCQTLRPSPLAQPAIALGRAYWDHGSAQAHLKAKADAGGWKARPDGTVSRVPVPHRADRRRVSHER